MNAKEITVRRLMDSLNQEQFELLGELVGLESKDFISTQDKENVLMNLILRSEDEMEELKGKIEELENKIEELGEKVK